MRLPRSPIAPFSVSRRPRNERAQCLRRRSHSIAEMRKLSSGIDRSTLQEKSPAMHNVAFDIVNPKPELLAVRVVPGNGPPLRTSNHHHLSVDPVVFAPAKSVWKADVEPIQGCAQIVGNREDSGLLPCVRGRTAAHPRSPALWCSPSWRDVQSLP